MGSFPIPAHGCRNCCNIAITLRTRAPVYRLIWLLRAWRRALQHIESQHPPNKEYRNNCPGNVDDPVATCFRIAEIEHDGIVARGSNKAPIGSWRKIPITLIDPGWSSSNRRMPVMRRVPIWRSSTGRPRIPWRAAARLSPAIAVVGFFQCPLDPTCAGLVFQCAFRLDGTDWSRQEWRTKWRTFYAD